MNPQPHSLWVFAMAWAALLAIPVQVTAVETPFGSEEVVSASHRQVHVAPSSVLASGRHWRHLPHGYFGINGCYTSGSVRTGINNR